MGKVHSTRQFLLIISSLIIAFCLLVQHPAWAIFSNKSKSHKSSKKDKVSICTEEVSTGKASAPVILPNPPSGNMMCNAFRFDGTESYDPENKNLSFFWDLGDGSTSNLSSPQHTYNQPGQYSVTLIATDSNTCNVTDTAFCAVDVFENPVAAFSGPAV